MMIKDIQQTARSIFKIARGLPLQIFIRVKHGLLARFANNGIHQNGFQDLFSYTLRVNTKTGPAYVESNDSSESGIEEALERLRHFCNGEILSRGESKGAVLKSSSKEDFPLSLKKAPQMAAQAIEEALQLILQERASANGYYSVYRRLFYLADSSGLETFYPATAIRFGVTLTKGAGKGYFSFYHADPRKLSVVSVIRQASKWIEEAARAEVNVKPGEYECVFSPRALLELIEPLRRHFDHYLCEEQKSVFTGLLGKKLFSPSFTLIEDVGHPKQFGIPFDAEGVPRKKVALIQNGILKGLLAEGNCTRGLLEHPYYPQNLVVQPGKFSLVEIFKRIRRGIFINKIWYHTLVREGAMDVTGLATSGSLYIEKGRIKGQVPRLRYHDSLFSLLKNVVATTKEQILLKDGEMGAALFPYLWVSRLKVV